MANTETDDDHNLLLSRVALGDRKAFSQLYKSTSPKLFGVCLRILRDRAQAEDALQEIYIKIWRRAGGFATDRASPMAWLVTIARNHAIDVIRARRPATVDIDEEFSLADPGPDPESHALNTSDGRQIENCLSELEADRAQAVVAAYVEGSSYHELAEKYSVPLNTMRTWLRRSLMKLKECMER